MIWSAGEYDKITDSVKSIIANPKNEICFSQISLIEVSIKLKLGKLPDFVVSIDDFETQLIKDGFTPLAIKTSHINSYQMIPLFAEHRDPFDRFLLATAFDEHIPIISADEKFELYKEIINVIRA
jgi:PIN domain nuclease of toxin-antitoxin system